MALIIPTAQSIYADALRKKNGCQIGIKPFGAGRPVPGEVKFRELARVVDKIDLADW